MIGYFITDMGAIEWTLRSFFPEATKEDAASTCDALKNYREKGWAGVKALGYDEYYLLGPATMESNQSNFTTNEIDSDKVSEAFTQFNQRKSNSRQVLKGIVSRICKQGA